MTTFNFIFDVGINSQKVKTEFRIKPIRSHKFDRYKTN